MTRTSPHDLAAERAVLGAVLLRGAAVLVDVIESVGLAAQDFYVHAHRLVFEAALRLDAQNTPIDAITIASDLLRREELRKIEGQETYLAALTDNVPATAHAVHYATTIKARARQRAFIVGQTEMIAKAYGDVPDIGEFLDEAEARVFALASVGRRSSYVHYANVLRAAFTTLSARKASGGAPAGLMTGFADLDDLLGGMENATLIVFAGRPSSGKSLIAQQMGERWATDEGIPVLLFSLEMSAAQLGDRTFARAGQIDLKAIRRGALAAADWQRLTRGISRLSTAPMWLDECAGPSILELRARARKWIADPAVVAARAKCNGPVTAAIEVDFLQNIRGSGGKKAESREREVAECSRGLKVLAMELGVPVVALTQLNRQMTKREDKRPLMSDLRESGSIEQDADQIVFVHRPEQHDKASEKRGIAEIIIGKNRNGETGMVDLAFIGSQQRFENLERNRTAPRGGTERQADGEYR